MRLNKKQFISGIKYSGFELLFNDIDPILYSHLSKKYVNENNADDYIQIAHIKIWTLILGNKILISGDCNPRSFTVTCCLNAIRDQMRKDAKYRKHFKEIPYLK